MTCLTYTPSGRPMCWRTRGWRRRGRGAGAAMRACSGPSRSPAPHQPARSADPALPPWPPTRGRAGSWRRAGSRASTLGMSGKAPRAGGRAGGSASYTRRFTPNSRAHSMPRTRRKLIKVADFVLCALYIVCFLLYKTYIYKYLIVSFFMHYALKEAINVKNFNFEHRITTTSHLLFTWIIPNFSLELSRNSVLYESTFTTEKANWTLFICQNN